MDFYFYWSSKSNQYLEKLAFWSSIVSCWAISTSCMSCILRCKTFYTQISLISNILFQASQNLPQDFPDWSHRKCLSFWWFEPKIAIKFYMQFHTSKGYEDYAIALHSSICKKFSYFAEISQFMVWDLLIKSSSVGIKMIYKRDVLLNDSFVLHIIFESEHNDKPIHWSTLSSTCSKVQF